MGINDTSDINLKQANTSVNHRGPSGRKKRGSNPSANNRKTFETEHTVDHQDGDLVNFSPNLGDKTQ